MNLLFNRIIKEFSVSILILFFSCSPIQVSDRSDLVQSNESLPKIYVSVSGYLSNIPETNYNLALRLANALNDLDRKRTYLVDYGEKGPDSEYLKCEVKNHHRSISIPADSIVYTIITFGLYPLFNGHIRREVVSMDIVWSRKKGGATKEKPVKYERRRDYGFYSFMLPLQTFYIRQELFTDIGTYEAVFSDAFLRGFAKEALEL